MKQETIDLINNFMETLDHSYDYKTKNERNLIREEIVNIVECEVKNLTIPRVSNNEVALPDYELEYCEKCMQMKNHLDDICQKCKGNDC